VSVVGLEPTFLITSFKGWLLGHFGSRPLFGASTWTRTKRGFHVKDSCGPAPEALYDTIYVGVEYMAFMFTVYDFGLEVFFEAVANVYSDDFAGEYFTLHIFITKGITDFNVRY
jgi:hypothetical protein